jgi:hypothetical protein
VRGRFAGIAESSAATGTADPAVHAFQRQVHLAIASAELPQAKIAGALLDVARAAFLVLLSPIVR